MANIYDGERENSTIVVNGVRMTLNEYKKRQRAAKAKDKKPGQRQPRKEEDMREIVCVSDTIVRMLRPITALKSFSAYYDNAYKQWGTISNDILGNRKIRPHFVHYRAAMRELDTLITEVQKCAKRNEKAAYQFVERISWKLEDISELIGKIMKGAHDSGVLEIYGNHEAINGKGRRLGLQTLVGKAHKAIQQLKEITDECRKIADEGVEAFDEIAHLSLRSRSRLKVYY